MSYMTINKTIEIKWIIKDYLTYGFGVDKNLYNTKTNRQIKQVINN